MREHKGALVFALDKGRIDRRDTDFAAEEDVICALAGEVIPQKRQADTRHFAATWNEVTTRFVPKHGGWDAIETHGGNGFILVGRDIEDIELRDAWLCYDAKHANPVYVKNEQPARV